MEMQQQFSTVDHLVVNIDDYEIGQILGFGSLGCIHSGVRRETREPVAIKWLKPPNGRPFEEDFLREFQILAGNRYPATLHLLGLTRFGGEKDPVIIAP
jgi:serine/threonine protein kinase